MTDRGRDGIRLFEDERAYIPFALIGALLMIMSIGIVVTLETRGDVEADTDPSLAMDRTDSALQTALRVSVREATDDAAEEPVTHLNTDDEFGAALHAADGDNFTNYVRALIYLEAADRLEASGQQVRDVETNVSIPDVEDGDDLEDALGRVEIHDDGTGDGMLNVTLHGVTVKAERDGETIAEREESVTVVVPTPVFELHDRVEEYEHRLDEADVTEAGMSQRFNAYMYGLGWARGYGQYTGLPINEVIANRHVDTAANDAVYRTQLDVFGAADPQLRGLVRQAWLCMAIQDGEQMYEEYEGSTPANVSAEDLCKGLEMLYGGDQATGEMPEAPEVQDLMSGAPGMDKKHDIEINQNAYLPLRNVVGGEGEHAIDSIIDRVFTVRAETSDVQVDRPGGGWEDFDHDRDSPDGYTYEGSERTVVGTTVVDSQTVELEGDEDYYRFEATVETTVRETLTWTSETETGTREYTEEDTASYETEFSVTVSERDHSMDANVDNATDNNESIARKYDSTAMEPTDNYVPAPEDAAEELIGENPEEEFARMASNTAEETDPSDVDGGNVSVLDAKDIEVDLADEDEDEDEAKAKLTAFIVEDLRLLAEKMEKKNVTFKRADLIQQPDDDGPAGKLVDQVAEEQDERLARDDAYANVPQKALYEARYSYFQLLIEELRRVEGAHDETMGALDDKLDGANTGLDDALEYMQAGTSADEPDADADIESPAVGPEIRYEVSGSPTYLVDESVEREDVPPVPRETRFAPKSSTNKNFFSVPYDKVIGSLLEYVPGVGDSDAKLTLRMAGELLRAGNLAAEIDEESVDNETLGKLETSVDDEITGEDQDSIVADTADELKNDLQADSPVRRPAKDVMTETLEEEWDTPAKRAIALTDEDGEAVEMLATAVAEELDDEKYRPAEYDSAEWRTLVAATTRYHLRAEIADSEVRIDNDNEQLKNLDGSLRETIEKESTELIKDRLNDSEFELSEEEYEKWFDGQDTPNRVPAGMPVTPVPGYWFATANVWDVQVKGEYARFEVSANVTGPSSATGMTYVRDRGNRSLEVDGEEAVVGYTEPVDFETRSVVIVVVPPGGVGVGDRTDERQECTENWAQSGPVDEDDLASCAGTANP